MKPLLMILYRMRCDLEFLVLKLIFCVEKKKFSIRFFYTRYTKVNFSRGQFSHAYSSIPFYIYKYLYIVYKVTMINFWLPHRENFARHLLFEVLTW